jgi:hypothetical protein
MYMYILAEQDDFAAGNGDEETEDDDEIQAYMRTYYAQFGFKPSAGGYACVCVRFE